MKMRVLYYTNKAKLKNIAGIITDNDATEKVNWMDRGPPPAYSCDKKERLVVMIVSVSKDPDNALVLFCKELTKAESRSNVAFIVDGSADGAKVLIDAVNRARAPTRLRTSSTSRADFRSSAESRTTRRRTSPSGWTRSPLIFSK